MKIDPTSQNRTAYDQIAARFAERNAEMLPYLVDVAAMLLDWLQKTENLNLLTLDLGCGAGRDMAWLEARGVHLVGGDLSGAMLKEARGRVFSPLCQLDMRCLPFRSGAFPAVWCQAALLHLPKTFAPGALVEMGRIIRPGGLLYVSVQKGESEGFETRPYEPAERYYAHYQPGEFADLLQAAGFSIHNLGEAQARRHWIWVFATKA